MEDQQVCPVCTKNTCGMHTATTRAVQLALDRKKWRRITGFNAMGHEF